MRLPPLNLIRIFYFMIKLIKQFFCKHQIIWKWFYGNNQKAYYDDFLVGKCEKCGKEFSDD